MLAEFSPPAGWPQTGENRSADNFTHAHTDSSDALPRLALALSENRSSLPPEARAAISALIVLAIACTIGPALRGLHFVPVAVIAGMGGLLLALEWFARKPVPNETLLIDACHARGQFHSAIIYGADDNAAFTKINQLLSQQG